MQLRQVFVLSLLALVGCGSQGAIDAASTTSETVPASETAVFEAETPANHDASTTTGEKLQLADVAPELIEQVNFSVPDMMCEFSCAPKVREVLASQPGVVEVEVDLPSKTAAVKADKTKFNAEAAVAALVDVQFDATRQISAAEAAQARSTAPAAGE